jgi:hypothetical protein
MTLDELVADFAVGLMAADRKAPRAINQRSKEQFQPGIGPHTEAETIRLVMEDLRQISPVAYGKFERNVPYPKAPLQKCDLVIHAEEFTWFVEVKMLRLVGDNGKLNDNMLMHILSPYPQHRSALTDCEKLAGSGFSGRKAIFIYGYAHKDWPAAPAIQAFEALARLRVQLSARAQSDFVGLCHPIHQNGSVFGWELL